MTRLITAFIVMLFISCGSSERKFDTETYEKTKETLEERERRSPEQFLVASSSDKKNLIGQQVIRVTIKNNASVCTYEDVQVKITFMSETGTVLEEDTETIYKAVPPNNSITHKTKYFAPKGTSDVRVSVVDAKVEEK